MNNIIQVEPVIDNSELEELKKIITSRYVTEHDLTELFENTTAHYTNSKYAISLCNGTCALFCALKAINIQRGDEVLVPNITFISTATAVLLAGAKVKLVDVDPNTCCIDTKKIEKAITSKTKAIMPVHLYGISCEMDEILEIAKKHNLKIIEDAAQGVGVSYKNKHVGNFGDFGILSYYGNKTITTGEGGIVLCKKKSDRDKIYMLKNHGRLKKGTFIHESLGWNFSFTEMQAAIGLAQMKKLDFIIKKKQLIFDKYKTALKNNLLKMRDIPNSTSNTVHWLSNIICDDAGKLSDYLKNHQIPSRRIFYPLNKQPCLKENKDVIKKRNFFGKERNFEGSEIAFKTILSLPSSVYLDEEQTQYIIEKLNNYK